MPIPAEFIPPLKALVHELAVGHFDQLEADGRSGRLTAMQLRTALGDYGRTFVDLPDAAFEHGQLYKIRGKEATWAVDLPLWTAEEGESDLTLQATIEGGPEGLRVGIDNLDVL